MQHITVHGVRQHEQQGEQADRFNQFCDLHRAALAHTQIGKVRQIVSAAVLVSEFEMVGAVVPGLPFVVRGTIESTADILSTGDAWVLSMRSTKIKTGTSNVCACVLKNLFILQCVIKPLFLCCNMYLNPSFYTTICKPPPSIL
jgi:hypothetical protein